MGDKPSKPMGTQPVGVFYREAMQTLLDARVPFLVGGAVALQRYTTLGRDTKDIDFFLKPDDVQAAFEAFEAAGFRSELTYSHWLGKIYYGERFVDIIFSSGNGIATVDDAWFEHADETEIMGLKVKLCPVEEIIWSKAFVMERERYDGADVAHLLRARASQLDWGRLLWRFGENWRVLLSHLILFGFIYPGERDLIPTWVMQGLADQLRDEIDTEPDVERVCRGTILSRLQYLPDIMEWGYRDARVAPEGQMTRDQVATWTTAALKDGVVAVPIDVNPEETLPE